MPERIGVVIILLDVTKKKLLAGKRKNAYKAGMYGLPGGRVETKETLAEAVKRELYEETHLTAETIKYRGVVREIQEEETFIHFVFVCETYKGTPENAEPDKCVGWEWFTLEKIPEEILPGHLAAIDLFNNHKKTTLKEIL